MAVVLRIIDAGLCILPLGSPLVALPTVFRSNGRTTRPTISACSRELSFEDQVPVSRNLMNHVPSDPTKWDFDSALPTGVRLPGKLSDVDVDKALNRWPLRQRPEEVG